MKNRLTKNQKKALKPKSPPKTGPDMDPIIKFKLDQERDREIQKREDLETARLIYEEWKGDFINTPKLPEELGVAVNQLAADLEARIESPFKDYVIGAILNPIIAHLHQSVMIEQFTTKALLDCPHRYIKNGIETECEWGGIAAFLNTVWLAGKATFDCPQCGGSLRQREDMVLESVAREWAEKQKKKGKK